ncbi:MAG: WecB/TagA/CpsF family glycosyltransferase [Bryobacterales bacterium]|nr:WecB/TagA/CpsF family glycosyltransferase [Bryobacteraceae bacterium]MDW8355180.1 WecB/TagA/CpsF family glycosyltransferase [Bryobacterales bacterium]
MLARPILGMQLHACTYSAATNRILAWAQRGEPRYVGFALVNNVMEACDSPDLRAVTNIADLVTPDGMPFVWAQRRLGLPEATRVYGPRLTEHVLTAAAAEGPPVGFYGCTAEVLAQLRATVQRRWPQPAIRYAFAPPFRPLRPEEDAAVTAAIRASGVRLLLVGSSTPKQEHWMAAHRGRIPAVMLGVGAAFDFLAGTKSQAPVWMQGAGLEWLFRLATEPRRLWRRYREHNPRSVALFLV